jgi:Ca2+-binding EF-hand superfamily protein
MAQRGPGSTPTSQRQSPGAGRGKTGSSPAGSSARPKSAGGAKAGGAPNWPTCEWCGQKFSPSSLPIHQQKCRSKPEAVEEQKAIEELIKIEGPRPLNPNADWEQCPNCGERYGEFALPPHMKRCKRLLPYGKKKDGKQYGSGPPPPKQKSFFDLFTPEPFDDFGSGLTKEELEWLRKLFDEHDTDKNERLDEAEMGALLKQCAPQRVADTDRLLAEFKIADLDGDGTIEFPELARYYAVLKEMGPGAGLTAEEIEWLRMLFDRFDSDKDGQLKMGELADLLRQCFPSRAKDAKRLMAEIKAADLNKDGKVSFHEFLRYYEMLISSGAEVDEVAKMFHYFDRDGNGELDRGEFLELLHQLFPDRCDENEAHVETEFRAADKDRSRGISFDEFKAYYATLIQLYDRLQREKEAEEAAAEAAATAKALKEAAEAAEAAARAAAALKAAQDKEAQEKAAREAAEAKAKARKAAAEAAAKAREEEEAAARAREEEAARVAAEMVECKCGEKFLPHLLPQHQRSCEACLADGAIQDPTNGGMFVPCEWCGRTFFPDRLPFHQRNCKKRPEGVGTGIRPTITKRSSIDDGGTVGMYDQDPARRRRALQMGAALAAGALG